MKIIKELLPYVIILIVVVLIRTFLVTPVRVDGVSMQPTLHGGEIMILNKVAKLDRFDIVVIDYKDERLIKRLIAFPGETIEVKNGNIFINDEEITDEFGSGITDDFEAIVLSDNEYFVMGDNREDSKDSRYTGPFTKDKIVGTTRFIIYPFNSFGIVK